MKKTITLDLDESKVITFEFAPQEARTYQVSVNGLSGSFSAIELPPPKLLECRYLNVIDVNGIPFTSVSAGMRAVMREPMQCSASANRFSFTLHWRLNREMYFSIYMSTGIRFLGGFRYESPPGTLISGSSYISGTWRAPVPPPVRDIFEDRTSITYSWRDEVIGARLPRGVPLVLMLDGRDPGTMSSSYSGGNFFIENALVLT